MTDNESIKLLEACVNFEDCEKCPRCGECEFFYDREYIGIPDVLIFSLDLIKSQKAEIERLKSLERNVYETVEKSINKSKTDAVKEFAEKLKSKLDISACGYSTEEIVSDVEDTIDNLVKEMEKDK